MLLKAGADATKRDRDGFLAIDLAPDREVSGPTRFLTQERQLTTPARFADSLSERPRRRVSNYDGAEGCNAVDSMLPIIYKDV